MSSSKPLHDETRRAWQLARRYLRVGTRSTDELRTYLRTKQVPPALIPPVVQHATEAGLLDDRACAILWATRLADQGYARQVIRQRLEAKGLAVSLVSRVLASRGGQDDEASRAREVVQRRLPAPAGTIGGPGRRSPTVRDLRLRRRLTRLLAQRGFDSDLIDRVLAEFLEPLSTSF